MKDIDTALRRLSEQEAPSRLSLIDAAILERVQGYSLGARNLPGPFRAAAIAAALVMGIGAGLVPDHTTEAKDSLVEISGAARLAPSTLLVGGW